MTDSIQGRFYEVTCLDALPLFRREAEERHQFLSIFSNSGRLTGLLSPIILILFGVVDRIGN